MREAHRREYFYLVLLAALAAACAGGQPAVQDAAPDGVAVTALFDLPAPSTLLARDGRQASVEDGPLCRTGDAYVAPANKVYPDMGLAKFVPTWTAGDSMDEAAYCCYAFDLTGFSDQVQLAYSFIVPPAKSGLVYLGVANFAKDAWDWYAAPLIGMVVLADDTPYRSVPSNEMLVVVACIGEEGIDLANIRVGNTPPEATFTMNPSSGLPGEVVSFDATGSSDADGQIAKWQWDPEGDGTYIPLIFGHGSPTKTITYSQPGLWHPTLKVTDDSGVADTYSETLNITMGNKIQGVLDNTWGAGQDCSAAVLTNNCPAVAYMVDYSLRYMYALSPDAYNWSDSIEIDPACEGTPDLAVIAGRPAIAFQNGSYDLGYARANNSSGLSWPAPKVAAVKYDVSIGFYPVLAEVGGLPGIAYSDAELVWGGTTWFVRGDDVDGVSWQPVKHVSPGGSQTIVPSLAVVNGLPMLTYLAAVGIDPVQIDCSVANDVLGDAWNPAMIAVGTCEPDTTPRSLVVAGGKPAIGYFDNADDTLKFARASVADGSHWNQPYTVAVTPHTGTIHCFAVINGLPCCAYGVSGGGLYYVIATNSIGSSWNEPIVVDATANPYRVSLIEVYGLPAIAFFDGVNRELGFVIYE